MTTFAAPPPPQFRLQPLHVVLGPLFALQSGRDLQTGTLSHGQMGRILPLVAEETVFLALQVLKSSWFLCFLWFSSCLH